MNLLNGKNIKPKTNAQAKQLIGKKIQYLQNSDIDKSGRGYFFSTNRYYHVCREKKFRNKWKLDLF